MDRRTKVAPVCLRSEVHTSTLRSLRAFRHDRRRQMHTSRASLVLAVSVESASLDIVAQPGFCILTTPVQGVVSYA
ncbi:hypothetical protein CTA2_10625 [Colletotrichum tanaceti]|uniref:Uncharacterized protein n=1 Tax=Colletotrichum tanaceti TaxID=1306861 RepID=A0A4U6X7Y2_9PEZI|nr:hypothetical protein CTA2_10625 [Colletotrichum tanaceti]TKW51039.1 hypothetical protein CTA1_3951 [Colletotrichum tanaceti]